MWIVWFLPVVWINFGSTVGDEVNEGDNDFDNDGEDDFEIEGDGDFDDDFEIEREGEFEIDVGGVLDFVGEINEDEIEVGWYLDVGDREIVSEEIVGSSNVVGHSSVGVG